MHPEIFLSKVFKWCILADNFQRFIDLYEFFYFYFLVLIRHLPWPCTGWDSGFKVCMTVIDAHPVIGYHETCMIEIIGYVQVSVVRFVYADNTYGMPLLAKTVPFRVFAFSTAAAFCFGH